MPTVTPKGFPTVLHRNTVELAGPDDQVVCLEYDYNIAVLQLQLQDSPNRESPTLTEFG
jgi:hypothetical protein